MNVQAALNVPIVEDLLAVRLAGQLDESDANGIESINGKGDPLRTQTATAPASHSRRGIRSALASCINGSTEDRKRTASVIPGLARAPPTPTNNR